MLPVVSNRAGERSACFLSAPKPPPFLWPPHKRGSFNSWGCFPVSTLERANQQRCVVGEREQEGKKEKQEGGKYRRAFAQLPPASLSSRRSRGWVGRLSHQSSVSPPLCIPFLPLQSWPRSKGFSFSFSHSQGLSKGKAPSFSISVVSSHTVATNTRPQVGSKPSPPRVFSKT